ncbi:hypothetical protein PRZ48_000529 [Zasmidium cellare]|uniref:Uncharacterized protein n=1 Tax=Zasmidium cellare TaxID=395010 RepID=A0ABR0F0B1_ZASCE|nr:hypothetical protein PRZ48_000529 [Zasmidium cellare]
MTQSIDYSLGLHGWFLSDGRRLARQAQAAIDFRTGHCFELSTNYTRTRIPDMRSQHDDLSHELEAARAAYEEVSERRDTNTNPSLEDALNLQYLKANNRLARASREYSVFIHEISDGNDQLTTTNHDNSIAAMLADGTQPPPPPSPDHSTLVTYTSSISRLERERQNLVTDETVSRLSEHIAYIEHLNTSLTSTVYAHQNTIATLTNDLNDAQRLLDEFNQQIEEAHGIATGFAEENAELKQENTELNDEVERLRELWIQAQADQEDLEHQVQETGIIEGSLRVKYQALKEELAVTRGLLLELEARGVGSKGEMEEEDFGDERLEDSTELMDRKLIDAVANMGPCVRAHRARSMFCPDLMEWV